MITIENGVFNLSTKSSTYLFSLRESGHLEHLYYGKRLNQKSVSVHALRNKIQKMDAQVQYSENMNPAFMDTIPLEYSTPGKGDCREPMFMIEYNAGMTTLDFVYESHRIYDGKMRLASNMPQSYAAGEDVRTLVISLKEKILPFRIDMYYSVFENADIIARQNIIYNDSDVDIRIRNAGSLQLDIDGCDYDMLTFDGSWGRERYMHSRPTAPGIIINDSKTGLSSNEHNPLICLRSRETGECIGFNLLYSGNHREAVEVTPFGMTRVVTGINPATFNWILQQRSKFITPEAVLTRGDDLNEISGNFHYFVNTSIIRGTWKNRQRPVLLNNWEGTYFDFTEKKLHKMIDEAKDLGIELFVLDDGWFGVRNDDRTSLGDWFENTVKLPSGLRGLSRYIHSRGMMFGLWVEPEMISEHSMLFSRHPDWRIAIPEREPSAGRHQYILDLSREEVADFIYDTMFTLFSNANVDYVKWDMNRTFSDIYSANRDMKNHGEFGHRYLMGLYSVLSRLIKSFPNVLFEGCASGGNRFDLGMLCYTPQIWTSDNTDALSRTYIQEGTYVGYPQSAMGCHVSTCPNHQTGRVTDIETRFNVASFGVLGYELDITKLSDSDREKIRSQISFYKAHRSTLQYGRLRRQKLANSDSNTVVWTVSSPDKSEIMVMYFQKLNRVNSGTEILRVEDVDEDFTYEFFPRPHENIEIEHYLITGELLKKAGIKLSQQMWSPLDDENARFIGDWGSRLYILKKRDE